MNQKVLFILKTHVCVRKQEISFIVIDQADLFTGFWFTSMSVSDVIRYRLFIFRGSPLFKINPYSRGNKSRYRKSTEAYSCINVTIKLVDLFIPKQS